MGQEKQNVTQCPECGWTRLTGLPPWECKACKDALQLW